MLQYITIKLFTTIIASTCEFFQVYDKGTISCSSAWLYLAVINNVSEAIALNAFLVFYETLKEVRPIQPVGSLLV